jgi:uncharacterized protein (TIGR03000 family)
MANGKGWIITPELAQGREYFYVLKAEIVREGKSYGDSRQVQVQAGREALVDFGDLSVAKDSQEKPEGAQITVRMPKDARLLIDGNASALTSERRVFRTPELEPGKTYYYTLTAEVTADGKQRRENREVTFQAGQKVEVDFGGVGPMLAASR